MGRSIKAFLRCVASTLTGCGVPPVIVVSQNPSSTARMLGPRQSVRAPQSLDALDPRMRVRRSASRDVQPGSSRLAQHTKPHSVRATADQKDMTDSNVYWLRVRVFSESGFVARRSLLSPTSIHSSVELVRFTIRRFGAQIGHNREVPDAVRTMGRQLK